MTVTLEYLQTGTGPTTLQRIIVIGTSGSGKTTTAAALAHTLGVAHVELDALHWEPGWQEASLPVFQERVQAALAGDHWVTDGNYSKVRAITWSRADTIVWLDYPFWTVFRQLMARSARRILTREVLWGTNVESARAFFSRDSLLLWMLQTYNRRRREYPVLFARPENAHLTVIRLQSPAQTNAWLATLNVPDTNST